MGIGEAPGKVILIGEHLVVHGAPAIAMPLRSRRVSVRVNRGGGHWMVESEHLDHVRQMVRALGSDPDDIGLEISSDLPTGAGLGSSAAVAVALVRAMGFQASDVQQRAHALERLTHGRPSGVDDAVVNLERPIWFQRGRAPQVLEVDTSRVRIWVAVSDERTTTREAIERVRHVVSDPRRLDTLCRRVEALALDARDALARGDAAAVGQAFDDNHDLLTELDVSSPGLDRIIAAARSCGATGAKLTGGGLGGAIIAAADPRLDPSAALQAAGAQEVFWL